jgi:hypothetical protein
VGLIANPRVSCGFHEQKLMYFVDICIAFVRLPASNQANYVVWQPSIWFKINAGRALRGMNFLSSLT